MVFDKFDGYLAAIETEMRRSFAVSAKELAPYYGMISYHLGWVDQSFCPSEQRPGKRLRPVLCLLSCAACGGDWGQAVPAAATDNHQHTCCTKYSRNVFYIIQQACGFLSLFCLTIRIPFINNVLFFVTIFMIYHLQLRLNDIHK